MQRLLTAALLHGAEGKGVERLQTQLAKLRLKPKNVRKERLADVLAREEELKAIPAATFGARYRALPNGTPFAFRAGLLESRLEEDASDPGAVAALAALLSPEIAGALGEQAEEPDAVLDWLEFARAVHETPVRITRPADLTGGGADD